MNTETQFKDESKELPTFMVSGYCGSFEEYYSNEEISDEEIKKAAYDYLRENKLYFGGQEEAFINGIKWYKQRLKDIDQ